MTGGKESQGSADLPEVWKELPPPGQMKPSVLLSLVTCKPCQESAQDPAKAAGLESGTCVSCHVLNPTLWSYVAPGCSLLWFKEVEWYSD